VKPKVLVPLGIVILALLAGSLASRFFVHSSGGDTPGDCSATLFSASASRVSSGVVRVDLKAQSTSCSTSGWPLVLSTGKKTLADLDRVRINFPTTIPPVATKPAHLFLTGPAHLIFYVASPAVQTSVCPLYHRLKFSLPGYPSAHLTITMSPLRLCHPLIEVSPLSVASTLRAGS
jgi:hypothetical protein